MGSVWASLIGLLWPAGAPLLAAWIYLQGEAEYPLAQWWPGLTVVTLAIAALVGLRFGRTRVAAAAALMYFSLSYLQQPEHPHFEWVFVGVGCSLLALVHIRESALLRVRAIPLWGLGAWVASVQFWPTQWTTTAAKLMTVPPWFDGPTISPLEGTATCFAALVALGLFLRMIHREGAIESGFLGAFMALWFAANHGAGTEGIHLFQLAGATALFLSVIERSHALAYRDQLTGLPGRRALEESLSGLGHRYTLAMVDVDRFKKFNDTYGHDAGDEVLRMVASRLKGLKGGRAYRYGGEEFTLIFPGQRLDDVVEYLDTIRRNICEKPFTLRSSDRPKKKPNTPKRSGGRGDVKVSVSIGAAQAKGRRERPGQVLKSADECLYKAKKSGRNRVIAA